MTHLVARLILTMLILPVAGAVFVLGFMGYAALFMQSPNPPVIPIIVLWSLIYAVVAIAWIMIWRPVVIWTRERIAQTALSAAISLGAGFAFGFAFWSVASATGMPIFMAYLAGGGLPPIVWICATVLTWRETAEERTERLAGTGPDAHSIVCPVCGYDMGSVRAARCPECGAEFTIGQLVAAQPRRALQTLDNE